jgi:mannosyltransferase
LPRLEEEVRRQENTPPLYYLVVNLWIRVFGDSDRSLRMPSALMGAASVAMMYLLAKRLFQKNPRAHAMALASALLLAISRYHNAY